MQPFAKRLGSIMIGRYSQAGTYRELMKTSEFLRTLSAGLLVLAAYMCDSSNGSGTAIEVTLALASVTIGGAPIIWRAVTGIAQRKANVDELVSMAIIASVARGDFFSAAVVSLVMGLGTLIEQATSNSARRAIRSLISISPQTATALVDGHPMVKPAAEVRVGETLLVKPGDRIPVDATVTRGVSAVDESALTGESAPSEKRPGDVVNAGTLNLSGVIEVEAVKVGRDTTFSKVIKLVSEAEAHKPQTVRVIDRYARWFTPTILVCAAAVWCITGMPDRAITVLIVGCPCALILAAPTAVIASIGRASRSGILVKGGQYLEEAGRAEVILFDKTGTLTEGKPLVNEVIAADGVDENDVLALAACAEQNCTHPLARAVLKAAHYAKVKLGIVEGMCVRAGFGIQANIGGDLIEVGKACDAGEEMSIPIELCHPLEVIKGTGATPLIVYRERCALGIISVADKVRGSAKETARRLRSLGIRHLGILSGDHEKAALQVSESLQLTEVWWEMKPEDKVNVIKNFQKSGTSVIFVGDGINDAPALATADVGIAMGGAGTEVALETADIVLIDDDILKLPFLVRLSRRMLQVIKINIVFGMTFNAMAVLLSSAGLLSPIAGALVHNIGSVLVVLSSASMSLTTEKFTR
jgi:Cd2+/Zn2+-exporting ATPase